MALYVVCKSEGGQMKSAINSQVLAKLHLGFETEGTDRTSTKLRKAVIEGRFLWASCKTGKL